MDIAPGTTTVQATRAYYRMGVSTVAQRERPMGMGNGTAFWLHGDHLGGATLTTNTSGAKQNGQEYGPWGNLRQGDLPETTVDFTGQRRDDTGLLYYGARYYDPVLGRFLSADPIGVRKEDPQSLNRYSYVRNNPVNRIDPTGNVDCDSTGCGGYGGHNYTAFAGGAFGGFSTNPIQTNVPISIGNGYSFTVTRYNQTSPFSASGVVESSIVRTYPNTVADLYGFISGGGIPAGQSIQLNFDVFNYATAQYTEVKPNNPGQIAGGYDQLSRLSGITDTYFGGVCPIGLCQSNVPFSPTFAPLYTGNTSYSVAGGITDVNYYPYALPPGTYGPSAPGLVVYDTRRRVDQPYVVPLPIPNPDRRPIQNPITVPRPGPLPPPRPA